MNKIKKTAIVHSGAELDGVTVADHVIVEEGVSIGKNTILEAFSHIKKGTIIGENNIIGEGSCLGQSPMKMKRENAISLGELKIGNNNRFFEKISVCLGSDEDRVTTIGDDNLIAHLSYVGSDVVLGNELTILNHVMLLGNNKIDDKAFLSSRIFLEEGVDVGCLTLVTINTVVSEHLPPFLVVSRDKDVSSLNLVGIKRSGYNSDDLRRIKSFYKSFFKDPSFLLSSFFKNKDLTPSEQCLYSFIEHHQDDKIFIRNV